MVLNKYRSMADPFIEPIAKRLENVNPDTISWIAFAFAILAGALFVLAPVYGNHLLVLALLSVILNAFLDALDGWIARSTGKASVRGDLLDHILDRISDVFIFGGIAVSAYCNTAVGFVAFVGVIMTSYMGTQAQALGLGRNYGGVLGRADRLVMLILFVIAQWAWTASTGDIHITTLDLWGTAYPLSVLEVLMLLVAVLGNITAVQRAVWAWNRVTELEGTGTIEHPSIPEYSRMAFATSNLLALPLLTQ